MNDSYNPKPIDTTDIELPEELKQLVELLAHNVHDTWAKGRMDEGWTYGSVRNEEKKETPCLVPYEELPEIEKAYDRNSCMETLKLIIKVGYRRVLSVS